MKITSKKMQIRAHLIHVVLHNIDNVLSSLYFIILTKANQQFQTGSPDSGFTHEMNRDNQPVLKPLKLGDLDLPNRVIMAPLTRTRARNAEHVPTDLMLEYYRERASAGLIFTEGTFVSDVNYIFVAGN
jgi:hypothetical protein